MSTPATGRISIDRFRQGLLEKVCAPATSIVNFCLWGFSNVYVHVLSFSFFLFTKVDACPSFNYYAKNVVILNGRSYTESGQFGERKTLGCGGGFFAYGGLNQQKTIFCQTNGQWSSDMPRCEGK